MEKVSCLPLAKSEMVDEQVAMLGQKLTVTRITITLNTLRHNHRQFRRLWHKDT